MLGCLFSYLKLLVITLLSSRFTLSTIDEFDEAGLQNPNCSVSHKFKGDNYFVISGLRQANGNVFYWKRVLGEQFISDLFIEYNEKRKADIEKYIGRISKSFKAIEFFFDFRGDAVGGQLGISMNGFQVHSARKA